MLKFWHVYNLALFNWLHYQIYKSFFRQFILISFSGNVEVCARGAPAPRTEPQKSLKDPAVHLGGKQTLYINKSKKTNIVHVLLTNIKKTLYMYCQYKWPPPPPRLWIFHESDCDVDDDEDDDRWVTRPKFSSTRIPILFSRQKLLRLILKFFLFRPILRRFLRSRLKLFLRPIFLRSRLRLFPAF